MAGGLTILMFENNPAIAEELCGQLISLGYSLLPVVKSEAQAESALKEGRAGLILLDVHFGNRHNGLQMAAHIRATYELPVIFIVPEKNPEVIDPAGLAEADGFILLPSDNNSIHASVEIAIIQNRKQKSVRENQNHLAAILKSIGDGIVTVNEKGNIQFINSIAASLTGLSETSAIGVSLDSVVTIIEKARRQQISTADIILNRRSTGPLSDFEMVLIGPKGIQFPVEGTFAPLRDHLGNSIGAVIAFRSLSEIQHALRQIKNQAARSEALLRIIARINSQFNIEDILTSFLQETTHALEADASAVFLAEEGEDVYRNISTYAVNERLVAYHSRNFEFKSELVWRLLTKEQPVICIPNVQELNWLPYQKFFIQEDIRTMILAGLKHEEHTLGVLAIINVGRERDYSRGELQFIKGLADQASLAIDRGQLFEKLRASRSRLQMVTKRLVDVQEAERRAVARELHDQVGQVLTGLQFSLESGKRLAEGNLRGVFEDSQKLVTSLMKQTRELSLKLAPSMLDDMGLLRTLVWHFEQYRSQTGIEVRFTHSGLDKRFSSEIETTAFRIIQEALTNVARYAKVNQVDVVLNADDDRLNLEVRDLGIGFDIQKTINRKTTFGLTSMKERAYLIGGQLSVKSEPGTGTELLAVLPISGSLDRRRYER